MARDERTQRTQRGKPGVTVLPRPAKSAAWRTPAFDGPFLAFCLLAIVTALMGGSARADVQSLIVLRPVAALLLGYGLWLLDADDLRRNKVLLFFAVAVVSLPLLQLIPLPFSLWSQLPGREQIAEIDRVAGLGQIARPLSLVPDATLNSLASLIVPAAALILAIRFDRAALERLLPLCAAITLVSAALGILQTFGSPGSALYFYEITNPSAAVGLFANRNHQACLLALTIPMLLLWGARRDGGAISRRLAALAGIGVLIPLILITGSRSGLIAAAVGLVVALALLPRWLAAGPGQSDPGFKENRLRRVSVWGAVLAVPAAMALATIWLGRAESWDRMRLVFTTEDLRFKALPTMVKVAAKYWPAGTGMGSFERVYQANEPDQLLSPVFLNHAHNDWLEMVITGGLPAVILISAALGAILHIALRALLGKNGDLRTASYVHLGLIIIALIGIISVSDYPLRTPLLQIYFVIAMVWVSCSNVVNTPIANPDRQNIADRSGNRRGR